MNSKFLRTATLATSALALAFSLSACGAGNESDGGTDADGGADTGATLSGTLNGAGASSQQAAVAAWTQGFQGANPDVTVNYDPAGSGAGREQFIAGGIAFAGTDAVLDEEELTAAAAKCASDVIEIPTYVSPIAVIFNLEGVDTLNLSPETLGAIFAGAITKWNDPKIAADNDGVELPNSDITPVHRSDDSGTTENFTDYLDKTSGGTWDKGAIQTWPYKSGEGADGTSGVVAAVKGGKGTIGYADASQAGDLGVASIKVGDAFVAYSPEAATKAVDVSKEVDGGATSITFELDRKTTEADTYPLVLVSYQVACASYPDEKTAALVKGWLSYVTSQDGQKAAAAGAGSAPLSVTLSDKIAPIVEAIAAK